MVFLDIDSFASIVDKYGKDTVEAKEAVNVLRASIAQTISHIETFYGNRVVVMTVLLDHAYEDPLVRKRRAIGDEVPTVS